MATVREESYSAGKRIREIREARNLTQEDLAEIMSMSVSTLYRLESGKQPLPVELLLLFSDALQVPVIHLLPLDKHNRPIDKLDQKIQMLGAAQQKLVFDTMDSLVNGLLAMSS